RSSQRSSISAGNPSRSAPSTSTTSPLESSSGSGIPPLGTRATRLPSGSLNLLNGTRKSDPIEARTAFGPVGSAQPSDNATPAPNASAARSSAPTLPGSATRQSANVTGRVPRVRSSRRKTATTRGGCASDDTSASNSGSTSAPATSTSAGSTPAASPASRRSSPSAANSPSLSRQLRSWSLRTSLSRSLSRE